MTETETKTGKTEKEVVDDYVYTPTENQLAAMAEIKTLCPDRAWFQMWNALRIAYPDDFKDNDHDIYVVMNNWGAIAVEEGTGGTGEPPVIEDLNPSTGNSNTDVTLTITGTGFSSGATVNIGSAFGLVPLSINPTSLSVLVEAVNIASPGTLPVSVKNSDGQVSNTLHFIAQ